MKANDCLEFKKEIQRSFIQFLKEETNCDKNFKTFVNLYENQNNEKYWNDFNEKLIFIISTFSNFNPNVDLYDKIEKFFKYFKDEIKTNFTNVELFNLSKKSKLILFILFKNKIIIPNSTIYDLLNESTIKELKLPMFLFPEFKDYFDAKMKKKIKGMLFYNLKLDINDSNFIENFNEYRKSGVNHNYICELIRNDSVVEFIVYVTKNNISLSSKVNPSIFETNWFLIKIEKTSLIEYAAFYGSVEIFKYLKYNNVELKPSLWLYAIHSRNADLIHILEECNIKTPINFLKELLKLHDFEITNYFIENNLIDFNDEDLSPSIKYCNYSYYPTNLCNSKAFYYYNKCNYKKFFELIESEEKSFTIDFNPKMRKLTKIIFPSSMFLNKNYKYSLKNIKELYITSSNKKIDDNAFNCMYSLEKVIISKSVISIGKSCFEKCINLEEVTFESPSSVTYIGESAFSNCRRLKKISIPPLCKTIENFTFYNCFSLENINIHSNILSIGDFSFFGCQKLSSVSFELPSSVRGIKFKSFGNCSSLNIIHIPYSVISISNAFIGCNNLIIYLPPSLNDFDNKINREN
ncbi:hypothetical protein M9Y10_036837 [Tritrichomonas musculus]|uniref:Uncharacterized protein n=1 Tax=Tritrichomonas musculus TaxID=1915356 RepID=A0ABR2GTY5_9EUKA